MIINQENLVAMFQAYITRWQAGIQRVQGNPIDFLFTDFPSTTEANFYGWIDLIPGFREWLDERVFNDVNGQNYVVANRLFECSVAIPATKIQDDTYGMFAPIIEMQGAAWPVQLRNLVLQVFTSNPKTYTGVELAGTHNLSAKVRITNKTTDALSKSSFEAAILAAAAWKFSNGELIKPRFTHLLHGPALRSTVHDIVKAPFIASIVKNVAATENVGGVQLPNPNLNRVQAVELEELAGDYANYWWLVQAGGPINPIARQLRQAPMPKMDQDPFRVERNNKAEFIATGRAAAAPTFPWLVYGGLVPA